MKKISRKTVFIYIVGFMVLFAANEFFHVGGNELSWSEFASDEAEITVEECTASGEVITTHTLSKGQSIAMQTLLLSNGLLRTFSDNIQPKGVESVYDISIHFPAKDVSLQVIGDRYLSGDDGWLKIANKEWDTIFQGILAAG